MIILKLSTAKYLRLLHLHGWTWSQDANESDCNPSVFLHLAGRNLLRA